MQNDVLATGIMSFAMHEFVYFGRALPFVIMDQIPYFHKYKIQGVRLTSPQTCFSYIFFLCDPDVDIFPPTRVKSLA